MKPETPKDSLPSKLAAASVESSQLLSLLALAAGAVAMPQTSEADVIYTNLATPELIGPADNTLFTIDNLPGTARLAFRGRYHTFGTSSSSRWVSATVPAGYAKLKTSGFFALPVAAGHAWGTIGGTSSNRALVAAWTFSNLRFRHSPDGFSDMYFAFKFADSTQGNALRYGWIKVSLANSQGNANGPDLTITSWAYDTTGVQLPTGSLGVPEPSPVALLALGALTMGAKGLRSWRRNRPAPSQS